MKKTRIIILGMLLVATMALSGCSWIKDKLQSKVDEVNQGIADTAKEVSDKSNEAVSGIGEALGGGTAASGAVSGEVVPDAAVK